MDLIITKVASMKPTEIPDEIKSVRAGIKEMQSILAMKSDPLEYKKSGKHRPIAEFLLAHAIELLGSSEENLIGGCRAAWEASIVPSK